MNQNVDTLLDDFVKELEKIQETAQAEYLEQNNHVQEAMNAVNLDEASDEVCNLVQQWKKYSSQLICLAFNSSKYELPLVMGNLDLAD